MLVLRIQQELVITYAEGRVSSYCGFDKSGSTVSLALKVNGAPRIVAD